MTDEQTSVYLPIQIVEPGQDKGQLAVIANEMEKTAHTRRGNNVCRSPGPRDAHEARRCRRHQ